MLKPVLSIVTASTFSPSVRRLHFLVSDMGATRQELKGARNSQRIFHFVTSKFIGIIGDEAQTKGALYRGSLKLKVMVIQKLRFI